jgi:ATP-dependent RNA helicase DeaD
MTTSNNAAQILNKNNIIENSSISIDDFGIATNISDSNNDEITSFKQLGVPNNIVLALSRIGIKAPTEVQKLALPEVLKGTDVIIESQTGSGKTVAFTIPLLLHLKRAVTDRYTVGLVVTPTRELALQISSVILSIDSSIRPVTVIGGLSYRDQLNDLNRDSRLIIGTPGRIVDLVKQRKIELHSCSLFVLDEADEMLSMGFYEDMTKIIECLPVQRQGILASATVTPRVNSLAERYLTRPLRVSIAPQERSDLTIGGIQHFTTTVGSGLMDKPNRLIDIITKQEPRSAIIFCNTKSETDLVEAILKRRGYDAERINSDLTQKQRINILTRLRSSNLNLLIATDVAARGIDIDHIDLVVNYSIPDQTEAYVHRTGRTGRAGRDGIAISLLAPVDIPKFYQLQKSLELEIEQWQE